jgi:hypothetical protein
MITSQKSLIGYLTCAIALCVFLLPHTVNAGFVYTASFPEESEESETTSTVTVSGGFSSGGCMDKAALNYDKYATFQNDLCLFAATTSSTTLLTAATTTVATTAPAVTFCRVFFTKYERQGSVSAEVMRIKEFLNTEQGESLAISPQYDSALVKAVKRFQQKYVKDILNPWKHNIPTGYWYQSTRKKANELLGCPEGKVKLDNGVEVE